MTAWIVVTVVSKSATSWEIETFITAWSRTIRNCAAASTTRTDQRFIGRPYPADWSLEREPRLITSWFRRAPGTLRAQRGGGRGGDHCRQHEQQGDADVRVAERAVR